MGDARYRREWDNSGSLLVLEQPISRVESNCPAAAACSTNSALTSIKNYSLLLNGNQGWGGAAVTVHAGTFDNAFYSNRNGNMWACGWWQDSIYPGSLPNTLSMIRFGINGTTVTPDTADVYATLSPEYVNPPTLKTCSPLTEVLDSAGADHVFASTITELRSEHASLGRVALPASRLAQPEVRPRTR